MKTNVTLKSSDRILFGITIKQRTENGMLSVSDLQQAYEKARFMHGWSERKVSSITQQEVFKERLYYLLVEKELIKVSILPFMEMIDKEGLSKVLKSLGVWNTKGRGENRSVYADPHVWMLLAMEFNPAIYAKVVIWLADTLILDRIEAGNKFLPMNRAIAEIIAEPDYPKFAIEINKKIFGQHQRGIRNLASKKQLKEIAELENFITKAIDNEWVNSETQIINAIRKY